MARGPDAQTLLLRALALMAGREGLSIAITSADSRAWHSATFAGERHVMTVEAADSPELATWLTALPEAEFAIRGQLVADIAVTAIRRTGAIATATLEALTVVHV